MIEEKQPSRFRIIPQYSPATGRLVGFSVEDPEGDPQSKRPQYLDAIAKEYTEVPREELEKAEVRYTTYRAIFVLKYQEPASRQWWTIETLGQRFAIGNHYEPPRTEVARFWEIYHGSKVHASEGFENMKKYVMEMASQQGLVVKPDREANLDHYLYTLYAAESPDLLPWFFKTFFHKQP
jgi:hypothetical protein